MRDFIQTKDSIEEHQIHGIDEHYRVRTIIPVFIGETASN